MSQAAKSPVVVDAVVDVNVVVVVVVVVEVLADGSLNTILAVGMETETPRMLTVTLFAARVLDRPLLKPAPLLAIDCRVRPVLSASVNPMSML